MPHSKKSHNSYPQFGAIGSSPGIHARRENRAPFLSGEIKPKISVIIPAKNEALNLPWVLDRMPKDLYEVILVDAHSTDDSLQVAEKHYPGIRIMQQAANGKGSALVTGILAAQGDLIVMIDADGSMDPIEIHGLVGSLLSGADVVKSSRYVAGGGSDDISILRSAGNHGLRLVAKVLFKHDWSELAYGMAAFWADIIPVLNLDPIIEEGSPESKKEYGRGFEIEALLFTRSLRAGLRVSEVFSFEYPRRFGVTNLSTWKDGWRVLSALFRERFTPLVRHPSLQAHPIMVVGSGSEFLSGISHYTQHLATALAKRRPVAVILMRKLIPAFLHPARTRIGDKSLSGIAYPASIPTYDGVDWNGGRSTRQAIKFIQQTHPRVVIFQWWTAAVAVNYVRLARAAKKTGSQIVIEFHEIQDVGESRIPFTGLVREWALRTLLRLASGIVTHSAQDAATVLHKYKTASTLALSVIPHGPFDQLAASETMRPASRAGGDPIRLLFFGVLRSYKGIDDLAAAYHLLVQRGENVTLTIAGEPWGKEADHALAALRTGPGSDNVTIIDRYISDAEIPTMLADADLLVLPYHRSSASGPLALAIAAGLPVVTTAIPALIEVTSTYTGAVHVPIKSPVALADGIQVALDLVDVTHQGGIGWEAISLRYTELFREMDAQ